MKKNPKAYNPKTFRPMARQNIRFQNDLEIKIHKEVSSLRYGRDLVINVDGNIDDYIYAVKKSAYYNCIEDLKILVSKDKTQITLSINL